MTAIYTMTSSSDMDERRQSRFERGLVLLEGGHYEEAHYYLEASLDKEGYSEECYLAYTEACSFLNSEHDAVDREEEEDTGERNDELHRAGLIAVHHGLQHLEKGRYGRAIQKLREAVVIVPGTATPPLLVALNYKAQQYMERRLFRKAITLYDECLSLGDDRSKNLYLRAWAHLHAGNVQQAQIDVKQAQELLDQEARGRSAFQRQKNMHPVEDRDKEAGGAMHEEGTTPLGG